MHVSIDTESWLRPNSPRRGNAKDSDLPLVHLGRSPVESRLWVKPRCQHVGRPTKTHLTRSPRQTESQSWGRVSVLPQYSTPQAYLVKLGKIRQLLARNSRSALQSLESGLWRLGIRKNTRLAVPESQAQSCLYCIKKHGRARIPTSLEFSTQWLRKPSQGKTSSPEGGRYGSALC